MSEIGKKLNFPRTSEAGPEATQRYARKLTRTLDDMRSWLLQALKSYIDEQINNINIEIGTLDHGELAGLQDVEDHLYAFLVDGTRKFTGHGDGFGNDTALSDADPYAAVSEYAIKAYVDALLAYILASPVGTVIYIWEDAQGEKFLQRLIPGAYGQVLVTAGAGQRPFWDWVWESPGAQGSPAIVFYLIVESSFVAAKIAIDHTVLESAPLNNFIASNLGDKPLSVFGGYDRTLDTSVATAKIAPDHNEAVDISGDLTLDIIFSPLRLGPYDAVGITDACAASIALKANVYDSVGLTDEPIVAIV